jgi:hypothetical protein
MLTRTEVNLQAPGDRHEATLNKEVTAQHSRHSASLRSFLTIHDTRQRRLVTYFSVHIRILLDSHTRALVFVFTLCHRLLLSLPSFLPFIRLLSSWRPTLQPLAQAR